MTLLTIDTTLVLVTHLLPLATESDSPWALLLAGPAGAGAVYWGLYRYYRNTDKSHSFEKETIIHSQPVTGSDQKFDKVRGTERSSIRGNNVSKHRKRVKRLH